jgi:hypothetical protein
VHSPSPLQVSLTDAQREALVELGSRGSGGSFDPLAISQLFTLGLVEIRSADRRLILTEPGEAAFKRLAITQGEAKHERRKPS